MACALTINSVVLDQTTGNIIVQGNLQIFTACGGQPAVTVAVTCGGNTYNGTAALTAITNTFYSYTATIPTTCQCNDSVTVVVTNTCPNYTCTQTFSGNLCCCPKVITTKDYGLCSNNSQLVTFTTNITITGVCTLNFRRNFGDGFFGAVQTFTGPGSYSYVESHNYSAPGTYTSVVDVIAPPINCPAIDSTNVIVACTAGCYTNLFLATFCRFLEWLYILSASLAITMALTVALCFTTATILTFAGLALFAFLLIYILQCNKCVCKFFLKTTAQIFIVVGILMFMFWPPTTIVPPNVNCYLTPPAALGWALLFLGFGIAQLYAWYLVHKNSCPLTICDFWCNLGGVANLKSCTNIAFIGIFILSALLGFANPTGIGVSIIVGILIAWATNSQLLANAPLCNNTNQYCQ